MPPHPDSPPPDPERADLPVPWERIEALTDGELSAAEAADLRRAIAAQPAWSRAEAEVQRLVATLRQEGLYAFPPELAARIVAQTLAPTLTVSRRLAHMAAAAVLAVGAWSALTGGVPSLTTARPAAWVSAPVALPGGGLWDHAPSVPPSLAPVALLGALALLASGLWLARRWGSGWVGVDAPGERS